MQPQVHQRGRAMSFSPACKERKRGLHTHSHRGAPSKERKAFGWQRTATSASTEEKKIGFCKCKCSHRCINVAGPEAGPEHRCKCAAHSSTHANSHLWNWRCQRPLGDVKKMLIGHWIHAKVPASQGDVPISNAYQPLDPCQGVCVAGSCAYH
eukprot:1160101-Pelagomonas_calceolata.AAC.3